MGDALTDLRPVRSTFGRLAAGSVAMPAVPRTWASEPGNLAYAPTSLKIVHILRAPFGGLFRHVVDVTQGQIERGHRVGLICDSTTGGARAEAVLAELAPSVPNAIRAYTPHGGSLVYCPGTFTGGCYRMIERALNWRTDLFLFESSYIADLFRTVIGRPRATVRVVRNGIAESEFESVTPRPDATDIVCVGELRPVKAIDVLIEALAILKRSGRTVSATIAGEGPEMQKLQIQAKRLGIDDQVKFIGHCPARTAFTMGRMLAIPSRAESLPYVVLEAAAAGLPIIATAVGGVPEIFGPLAPDLIPPDDIAALMGAIAAAIDDPDQMHRNAQALRSRVRSDFSVNSMVECNLAAYREAIAQRKGARFP